MKKILLLVLSYLFLYSFTFWLQVSPHKYEYDGVNPWEQKVWKIKIINNEEKAVTLYLSKEDFIADDVYWTPKFVKNDWSEDMTFWLSNWIVLDQERVTLAPWETREIVFVLNIPENWEPWWHYWAVFLSAWWWEWQVAVQSRFWVLIIVKVNWEVNIDWTLKEFNVWIKKDWDVKQRINSTTEFTSLPVYFETLFENRWNVHIKPKWKIEILDEDWVKLENIWEIAVVNSLWVEQWKELVNYLPINDSSWNVLPSSERMFQSEWKWFWVENIDWTTKYISLQDYYDKKAAETKKYLKFWEDIKTIRKDKPFTAVMSLSYEWKDWKTETFSEEKTFYINYESTEVVMNWIIVWWISILSFIVLIILIFLIYILTVWKKNSEKKLREKLMKEMKDKEEKERLEKNKINYISDEEKIQTNSQEVQNESELNDNNWNDDADDENKDWKKL